MKSQNLFLGVLLLCSSCTVSKEIACLEMNEGVVVEKRVHFSTYESQPDLNSYWEEGVRGSHGKTNTQILFYFEEGEEFITVSRSRKETKRSFFPRFLTIRIVEIYYYHNQSCVWIGYDESTGEFYRLEASFERSSSGILQYSFGELNITGDYKVIDYNALDL